MKKAYFTIIASYLAMVLVLFAVASSCGSSRYANERNILEMDEISYILHNNYPVLHEYYMEGVLEVTSLKEVVLDDGEKAYNVKYRFIKYRYPEFNDRMAALKEYYPEVYEMYLNGVVEITSFYKYVDKDSGVIKHHVSFRRIYDFYYNDSPRYGGVRLIYRPRPFPAPRVAPRPGPGPRPNGPARPRPDTGPNNPQRPQPGNPPGGNGGGPGRGGRR